MEWNLKVPCWDFIEFEQGTISNVDSGSNSGSSSRNFCVDLKLGQVIDSGNESLKVSKMALSPSGSSKRPRPISSNSSIHTATCLVDGCNSDLTNSKEYHRRHKVCEVHSKTPQVSINGHKQRFCQQCSRFHSLEAFDEGKRSCRKRLDGHNRRRRKPQPDTSRLSSLFSCHQGTMMLQFSSPNLYQTTPLTNPLWTSMVKSEEAMYSTRHPNLTHKQNPFPESTPSSKKATGKQQFFPFHNKGSYLKLNHQTSPPKVCQQPSLLSFEANSSYEKLFSVGHPPPARVQPVVQSDCALSLLSSSPSQTSCPTLNHVMHPLNFSATPNLMDPGVGYGGLESIMDPNGDDCSEMIQMGLHHQQASPDNGPPQTLPFYWE